MNADAAAPVLLLLWPCAGLGWAGGPLCFDHFVESLSSYCILHYIPSRGGVMTDGEDEKGMGSRPNGEGWQLVPGATKAPEMHGCPSLAERQVALRFCSRTIPCVQAKIIPCRPFIILSPCPVTLSSCHEIYSFTCQFSENAFTVRVQYHGSRNKQTFF
jgi:hypothetical protein